MKKTILILFIALFQFGSAQMLFPHKSGADKNVGEIYRNEFTDLTGITVTNPTGTVTIEDPIGTVVLPRKALTLDYTATGNNYATIDLGQSYDNLYISCYVSVTKPSDNSSYQHLLTFGSQPTGGLEVCEFKVNYGATYFTHYGQPNNQALEIGVPSSFNLLQVYIDRVGLTADYYIDGVFKGQKATKGLRDLRYITFGGLLNAGTKLQFSSLTVNEQQFSEGVPNVDGIGEVGGSKLYVDYSMDAGINASTFTGRQKEVFDPDGGTNYTDGPLRYSGDVSSNYFLMDGEILYKRGVKHYLKDLATTNSFAFLGSPTTAEFNYTVSSYGDKSLGKPQIYNGILYSGTWSVYDAVNNVYESEVIPNFASLQSVRINDDYSLRQSTDLAELTTKEVIFYESTNTILVKLLDGVDPATVDVNLISSTAYTLNDFCTIQGVQFNGGGITAGGNSIVQFSEFQNAGCSVSDGGIAKYNTTINNWDGGDYRQPTLIGNNGSPFRVYEDGLFLYNEVENNYIGLTLNAVSHDALVAFNVFKNIIVNLLTINGDNGAGDVLRRSKMVNNTIFHSPRHLSLDPYPLIEDEPGHGFVTQLGGSPCFMYLNNLSLLHYNENMSLTSVANLNSQINSQANGLMDYNKYYVSQISTSPAEIFNMGNGNDISSWSAALDVAAGTYNGMDGIASAELNSIATTVLPVALANATITSGKWLETDPTPTTIGDGYIFDFSIFNIYVDGSGNRLTNVRNIGAK